MKSLTIPMINHGQKVLKIVYTAWGIVDCNDFKEDRFFNYLLGNTIHEELVADLKLVKMRRALTGS